MTPPFFDFLESKPLYYKEIDHKRIHRAYARIRDSIAHPPAIHVIGTNGKGSTGRMIAHLARSYGMENGEWRMENAGRENNSQFSILNSQLSVGHYSSPHILRFNERIWIDGREVKDKELEAGHRRLYGILGEEMAGELSYFEYTTLLALLLFEECDLIVLEAGLGGEYDATNVVENKVLTVVTPIGLDHQVFLGESIEEIATTKLRSITPGSKVLLAPQPYEEVYEVAERIADEKGAMLFRMENGELRMENEGVSSVTPTKTPHSSLLTPDSIFHSLLAEKAWPPFLQQNAKVALRALELLGIDADPGVLRDLELFGRFYPLRKNVRIDVGHNSLAARAIVQALEPGTVLIYNSLDDKDYREVLSILRPKISRVELIPIESQRAATKEAIVEALEELEIPWKAFTGELHDEERYLVFGSFYTVEAFLKSLERGDEV
ncbi:bifunctional folylpolyglutamate synthase/dihydrofolate synthase [Nitratifractor sp.]